MGILRAKKPSRKQSPSWRHARPRRGKKADQDRIANAIIALEKLLPPKQGNPGNVEDPGEIPQALLKKKLAGRGVFNKKTGLSLVYGFKDKNDLKDFDLNGAAPACRNGVLRIGPADAIRHVAKFKSFKVTGQFTVENLGEPAYGPTIVVRATGGAAFGFQNWNGTVLHLVDKDDKWLSNKNFGGVQINSLPITFSVSEKKATVIAPNSEIAGVIKAANAGQLELLGGKGGMQIRSLVISGIPDEEWVKEFFSK